jgi:hypothetical protein
MVRAALDAPDAVEGELHPCPLPSHKGEGNVGRRADGRLFWRCACGGKDLDRSLTEAYVGRVTGVLRKRAQQEQILWHLRLAVVAKVKPLPPPVEVPPLPDGAGECVRASYAGLKLFLRIRSLTVQRGEQEFAFARSFAAEWSGLTRDRAGTGIRGLERFGVLLRCGVIERSSCRATKHRPPTRYRLGDITPE